MDKERNSNKKRVRCINLDWLEIYCLESFRDYPHDADYFRSRGYDVKERDYGTRVYDEMFVVCDRWGDPMIEIRRKPVSLKAEENAVLDPMACHLRLVNRYCYNDAAASLMAEFCEIHGFTVVNLSRVDICLDFERFDFDDEPAKFIRRYLKHKYAKINQANIRLHGRDWWSGITINSLSWGSPNSVVSTKLYDKTLEIRQHQKPGNPYKPWIPQAWCATGLLTTADTLTKTKEDGTTYGPQIWRLEFSIRSGKRGWLTYENNSETRKRHKYLSIRNTLSVYSDRLAILNVFASLQPHYFRFVKYEEGKRKYDCEEKKLFDWSKDQTEVYEIERPLVDHQVDPLWVKLLALLKAFLQRNIDPEAAKACHLLIDKIERQIATGMMVEPWNKHELAMLQNILSIRISDPTATYEKARDFLRQEMIDNPPF